MSVETTREVLMRYLDSEHSDASVLAQDVVFTSMADGRENRGPESVLQMLHYFYRVAFQARAEQRNLILDSHHAVWEGEFVGPHIGEFAGIPATGKEVRVPLCVVYDLDGGKITRARIYLEVPVLLRQLGVEM